MKEKVEEYIDYVVNVKKSAKNTVESYRRDLYCMADFFCDSGITDIDRLTATSINSYILYLERVGKSPSTIVRNISSMKTFFHFMLSRGYVRKEPTELIKPPKVDKKQKDSNSSDAIRKLLSQPDAKTPIGIRDKAMLEVLYAAGLKVSEITDIKTKDVKLNIGCILYDNGKREKMISLRKSTRSAMDKYLTGARGILLKDKASEYLFVNCHGERLSRQGFWKILKEYAREAGIEEDMTPHTLAHSTARH